MEFKFEALLVVGAFAALGMFIAPAMAQSVTYVSGKGTDAGNCASPASPCRTFQFAVNQTPAGGEVKALDSADYGPVKISSSISITGVDGAGTNAANAISISAGNSGTKVNLTNLTLNGSGGGTGITFSLQAPEFVGSSVTIVDCVARNFNTGISIFGNGSLFLGRATVTGNNTGVIIDSGATGVSFGNNQIYGNGTNLSGTLRKIGTQ